LQCADADGDNSISFTEFFFFITLKQMPHVVINQEFEKHGGKMDAKSFSKMLTKHRKNTHFGKG